MIMAAALALVACAGRPAADLRDIPEAGAEVVRVEPLSWWTGMKTDLQLLVQGPDIARCAVSIEGGSGVYVKKVHKADNPDFVFVDVTVGPRAAAGTYWIVFRDGDTAFKYPYLIRERAAGSADRGSFTTADLIYLIMPDRFADGDLSNEDGFPEGAVYDDGSARPWQVPEILEKADRSQDMGRHGGDLVGLTAHLDYIADLGATAIWNTPLLLDNQRRESYHGYACGDYYHIDPRFGDNAQYRAFVDAAHERSLKVIMDVVTNHCGTGHWWMQDTPFADWYHRFDRYTGTNVLFSAYMDPHASQYDRDLQESGWFVPSMPDMNLDNPYLLKYFQQWGIWWIEYAGLDGFRVDTYPYNEPEPMARWCRAILDEYPRFNIVGECWDPDVAQLAYWQAGHPNPDGFDSCLPAIMDFPLRDAINAALCEDHPGWGEGMTRVYSAIAHDFAYTDPDNLLIFFANHDHARMGDVLQHDPARMKLALAMLATLRGIPQLFSGDEMLFSADGGRWNDGAKRIDFPGGWIGDPVDLFTGAGRTEAGTEDLHAYARRLFQWRKGNRAVQEGATLHFMTRDNTYAYFRYAGDAVVFVYINNADEPRQVPWSHYAEIAAGLGTGTDVLTGAPVTVSDATLVPAKTALVVEY